MKKYLILIVVLLVIIMGVCLSLNNSEKKNYKIVDKTTLEGISSAEALELFYQDENYEYYFPCIKSDYVVVIDENNNEINIKEALEKHMVEIIELDKARIKYYKERPTKTKVEFLIGDDYILELMLPSDYNYNLERLADDIEQEDEIYLNMKIYKKLNEDVYVNLKIQKPILGVCGTGLRQEKIDTNHGEASVGYYDGNDTFSFISSAYDDINLNMINNSNGLVIEDDNDCFIEIYKSIKILNKN